MLYNDPGQRLEKYTIRHPQEVLLVQAEIAGEVDQIVIFKGYSSSLTRPTSSDPDVPLIPETGTILTIDRLESPYDLAHPRYIQKGLTWEEFLPLLTESGI